MERTMEQCCSQNILLENKPAECNHRCKRKRDECVMFPNKVQKVSCNEAACHCGKAMSSCSYNIFNGAYTYANDNSKSSDGSNEKKDEYDEGTMAFLKIFAPELYEQLQMKNIIQRDIIQNNLNVQWGDIANQNTAKRLLKEAVILPLEKPTFFQGIRKPWKSVLLVGPPGTGKTMLAKAVATEKKTTFFNVSVSTLTSKFFGESEKLIKMLFEEAKAKAPSVIFIDEIDSLCSMRGEVSEHECTRRMKSELLCHMDGISSATNNDPTKSIIILGATNHPWNIDDAFLRRMEKRIYVPLPDSQGRQELLKILLRNIKVDSEVDLELVSDQLDGYSAADVKVVCRDAAFMCMRRATRDKSIDKIKTIPMDTLKKPITKEDFETAIKKCQKTVTETDIAKFEEWNRIFGSSV